MVAPKVTVRLALVISVIALLLIGCQVDDIIVAVSKSEGDVVISLRYESSSDPVLISNIEQCCPEIGKLPVFEPGTSYEIFVRGAGHLGRGHFTMSAE